MHVVEHVGDAALADLVGKAPHLIARHVDVRRERLVFVAELVAGAAEHVRNAAKAVGGAILLLVDARRDALLDAPSTPFAVVVPLAPLLTAPTDAVDVSIAGLGREPLGLFLEFVGMCRSSNAEEEQDTGHELRDLGCQVPEVPEVPNGILS